MQLRACHNVMLLPSAVYGGRALPSASVWWGTACYGVAQAAPASLHNAPGRGAAVACLTSALACDPKSPWGEQAGWRRYTSGWPPPPRPVRAAADGSLEQRRTGAPLPTSAWRSRAALRPASDRGRRLVMVHPAAAVRCSRATARQSVGHG